MGEWEQPTSACEQGQKRSRWESRRGTLAVGSAEETLGDTAWPPAPPQASLPPPTPSPSPPRLPRHRLQPLAALGAGQRGFCGVSQG